MTGLNKIVVATAAAVGIALAAAAYAHGPGSGYGPGGGMMGGGMMGAGPGFGMHGAYGGGPGAGPCLGAVDTRLDTIKSELKLTANQSKAWETFEKAVLAQAQTMTAGHPGWSGSAEEHIAFMEQRLAGMKAVHTARTDLYSVLTPEQKAVADRYWLRGPRG